jgi:hypothetical protein
MKQISIALLLCLCTLAGFAQSGKALDLKEIVSGKFTPKNISGVIPIPGFANECGQDTNHQILLQNGKTRGSAV